MEAQKRGRGRPVGTGIDDSGVLAAIADMLVIDIGLPIATAYKRIVHRPSDANIGRIHAKWRAQKETLIAEAKQRKSDRVEAERRNREESVSAGAGSSALRNLAFASSISGQLHALQSNQNGTIMQEMKVMQDPEIRAAKELHDSLLGQLIREQKRMENFLGLGSGFGGFG
jgi:hypothetical protein